MSLIPRVFPISSVVLATLLCAAGGSVDAQSSPPYRTVVVFGDTQDLVQNESQKAIFNTMVDWVINHRDSENIDFVLQVGDAIEHGYWVGPGSRTCDSPAVPTSCAPPSPEGVCEEGCYRRGTSCQLCADLRQRIVDEWKQFDEVFSRFEPDPENNWPGIPYAVVRGNHDNIGQEGFLDVDGYRHYFGPSRFQAMEQAFEGSDRLMEYVDACPSPECAYPLGQAWRFALGPHPVLVVGPSWSPLDGELQWLHGVLGEHQGTPTILVTHYVGDQNRNIHLKNEFAEQWKAPKNYTDQLFMVAWGHVKSDKKLIHKFDDGSRTLEVEFDRQERAYDDGGAEIAPIRFYFNEGATPDEVEGLTVDPLNAPNDLRVTLPRQAFSIFSDIDRDGVVDGEDNCTEVANPDQADGDRDEIGDACDPCPSVELLHHGGDGDADGIPDGCDPDHDNDGIPNEVDVCPEIFDPYQGDLDGDGVGDACDNCIYAPNPDQKDDGVVWSLPLLPGARLRDGIGNACQCGDLDGDGWVTAENDLSILAGCVAGSGDSKCASALADTDGVPGLTQADVDALEDALTNGRDPASLLCAPRPNADFDGDSLLDAIQALTYYGWGDPCRHAATPNGAPVGCKWDEDGDGDGLANHQDNCFDVPNEDQADRNGDGRGDACTPACDANRNGKLDSGDVLVCLAAARSQETPSADLLMRCDVAPADPEEPTNGVIDAADVLVIERALRGEAPGVCIAP